jgi:RNA polymerase sigma-70 factor (ECF subfamily)
MTRRWRWRKRVSANRCARALAKLSSDHKEIIDLVYYHEKSIDEAAQILSIPAATVKTCMFYARKNLAEIVAA